jgi:hemolysin activation/secretion protein
VAFNFHVRGLVGDEQEFADKRFKGRPGYGYFRGTASHLQTMENGWTMQARGNWQLSGQPLVSNEQFVIGGVDTVRGYLESAAVGDSGLAFSLEATTPNLAKQLSESLANLQLLAFFDAGTVRVLAPITATERFKLAGAGVGMRLKAASGISASLDLALALKDLGANQKGDKRLYFRVGYDW